MKNSQHLVAALLLICSIQGRAQVSEQVVDIPTRPGVTQRMLLLTPAAPKAVVVLLAGGHGGLQLSADGEMQWGKGNFLVRTRQQFAQQGLTVAVIDAPSDRQEPPFLDGFRQTSAHVADLKAVIAWLRQSAALPVWLVGTSRGTQSAAFVATELTSAAGPDGIVLTSSIMTDRWSRPVPAMPLGEIRIPALVVHHRQDGCASCLFSGTSRLMDKLDNSPRKELLAFTGGVSTGDPCQAFAHHGYNGLEDEVVRQISAWVVASAARP